MSNFSLDKVKKPCLSFKSHVCRDRIHRFHLWLSQSWHSCCEPHPGQQVLGECFILTLIVCVGKTAALRHCSWGGGEKEWEFHNVSEGEVGLEATEEEWRGHPRTGPFRKMTEVHRPSRASRKGCRWQFKSDSNLGICFPVSSKHYVNTGVVRAGVQMNSGSVFSEAMKQKNLRVQNLGLCEKYQMLEFRQPRMGSRYCNQFPLSCPHHL